VLWIPLDDRGNPTKLPDLPGWALPSGTKPKTSAVPTAVRSTVPVQQQANRQQGTQPQQNQVHSISEPEKKFRDARKAQETILGIDLANNILETLAAKLDVGEIKGEKFGLATAKLDAAVALLTKVREVAEHTHSSALRTLLLRHELQNLDTIPTFQKLYRIALDMQVVPAIEKRAA
jgi:hypothetical protein